MYKENLIITIPIPTDFSIYFFHTQKKRKIIKKGPYLS